MKRYEIIVTILLNLMTIILVVVYFHTPSKNNKEPEIHECYISESSMIEYLPEIIEPEIATPSSAETEYQKAVAYIEWRKSLPPCPEFIGTYELTAYEWSGKTCANGNFPTTGYTVACNSLPLGTRIKIKDYGEYTVEDRGGMGGNVIDIYLSDYNSCINFGRRVAKVYIIHDERRTNYEN